jgi:predicted TPR repeat methyltransferase
MTQHRKRNFLDDIYQVASGKSMRDAYNQWADQYDQDIEEQGYRTPTRVALALARHLRDKHAPILDFACGTGLSGQALRQAGFTCIDGVDLSEKMLRKALAKGIYRSLAPCSLDAPFESVSEDHQAIVAVGAIGAGAAPIECLTMAIDHLPPGGIFCVSLNDHTLQDPRFEAVIAEAVISGAVDLLEREHGEHLPDIDLKATVYVLKKR